MIPRFLPGRNGMRSDARCPNRTLRVLLTSLALTLAAPAARAAEAATPTPTPAAAHAPSPAESRLRADVSFLADDARDGRAPGTQGIETAAAYIAGVFKENGLKTAPGADGYFQ